MDAASSLPPSSSLLPISPDLVVSTTPSTSASSLSKEADDYPLPSLPTELKREIVRFCDPSTLAKTSLVSLAFLEMSSPLLHRDVVVLNWKQMLRFIDSQIAETTWHPRLERRLPSCHIRTFTFLMNSQHQPHSARVYKAYKAGRSLSFKRLALDELHVHSEDPASYLDFPLHLFDPVLATFASLPSATQAPCLSLLNHDTWPRLRRIVSCDCILRVSGRSDAFLPGSLCATQEQADNLHLTFEISRSFPKDTSFTVFLERALRQLPSGVKDAREIVARANEEELRSLERSVFAHLDEEEIEDMKQCLKFEAL